MVAEVTEGSKHKMEVQEELIVEVLVPMKNWCDSPNYGCKHYHMVNSWTYIHLGSSPQVVDFAMIGLCNPSWTYMN